ncbi:hypothetical protein GCM10023185_21670 [Hymenobacter saemangeumensis]|uniref:Uncharacterized protein n=1 Tax=Hymenobacter saemangeumensis TaxID=1084522 RepID=A0ABP8IEE3_9BACT
MDTQANNIPSDAERPAGSSHDHRPADQQARAAQAHPRTTDEPQTQPISPNYGEFGGVAATTASGGVTSYPANSAPRANDGSNDNPDEFSAFRKANQSGTEDYSAEAEQANPARQPGHVEQNQDPAAVRAAQGKEEDIQRTAWADDDPRYGSGQRTSWPSNEPNNIDDNPTEDGQR